MQGCPVYLVDAVGRLVRIAFAVFGAKHFFSGIEERNALAEEDGCLRKHIETKQGLQIGSGKTGTEVVEKAKTIVTADVGDMLCGLLCPGGMAIIRVC